MRKNKFILFTSLILLYLSITITGQDNFKKVAQSGMQYLKIGVDAAMVGRGEAGISHVKGASAMFWNAAGLAELTENEVMFSHNAWIADISMNAAALGMNLEGIGSFGLSFAWMDYGDLYRTSVATTIEESADLGYIDEGTFSPTDLVIGVAYAKRLSEQFSFGGQVRYLYENYGTNTTISISGEDEITENTLSAFLFDIGTRYYTGLKSLAFSMTIQNFSRDLKYEQEAFSAPLVFKLGVSMNLLDLFNNSSKNSILLAIDAIHPRDYTERLNIGLEFDYLGMLQLRGGYRMNYDEGNLTIGTGLKYPVFNYARLRLDLSYMVISSGRFSWPLQLTAGLYFL